MHQTPVLTLRGPTRRKGFPLELWHTRTAGSPLGSVSLQGLGARGQHGLALPPWGLPAPRCGHR